MIAAVNHAGDSDSTGAEYQIKEWLSLPMKQIFQLLQYGW